MQKNKKVANTIDFQTVLLETEKKLHLLQDRYRDVMRLSSDIFWETDADFTIIAVSDRVFDITSQHASQIIDKKFFETFNIIEDLPKNQKNIQAICKGLPFKDLLTNFITPNGDKVFFKVNGVPYFDEHNGNFLGYRGISLDITNEIIAIERANRLNQRLHSSLSAITVAVAIFDQDGVLIYTNQTFENFFPDTNEAFKNGDELTYQNLFTYLIESGEMLLSESSQNSFFENLMSVCSIQKSFISLPFEIKRLNNQSLKGQHIVTSDGDRIFLVHDITDEKNREAMLEAARDMAEASYRTKSYFLANVSHELRTPLNAILGFAELIASEVLGEINEQYKEYAKDIYDSAEHLLNLINDILDMAKIESGKVTLVSTPLNLYQLCENITRMLKQQAQKKNINITLKGSETWINGDSSKIQQMLINLLSNAIKFTPENGIITVDLHENQNEEILLSVIDTGIGIKAEHINKVILPFEQVDNSNTSSQKGTGLGLPLTKSLIEMHDGRLTISSIFGEGTTISLVFPKKIRIM